MGWRPRGQLVEAEAPLSTTFHNPPPPHPAHRPSPQDSPGYGFIQGTSTDVLGIMAWSSATDLFNTAVFDSIDSTAMVAAATVLSYPQASAFPGAAPNQPSIVQVSQGGVLERLTHALVSPSLSLSLSLSLSISLSHTHTHIHAHSPPLPSTGPHLHGQSLHRLRPRLPLQRLRQELPLLAGKAHARHGGVEQCRQHQPMDHAGEPLNLPSCVLCKAPARIHAVLCAATAHSLSRSLFLPHRPPQVYLTVWFPSALNLTLDDPTLNKVLPSNSAPKPAGCTDSYQLTPVRLLSTWTNGGAAAEDTMQGLDVTSLARFASRDTSVQVLGSTVRVSAHTHKPARFPLSSEPAPHTREPHIPPPPLPDLSLSYKHTLNVHLKCLPTAGPRGKVRGGRLARLLLFQGPGLRPGLRERPAGLYHQRRHPGGLWV
jgi:hypothetical protein